jgi:hypothetical protein
LSDPRDEIWSANYKLWYDSEYNAERSDRLISRWQAVDDLTKVIVALTTSGSVVAGWALWSTSSFKVFWAVLAGTGAVLSIVSSSLGVPARLKDWSQSKADFSKVAIELQKLRLHMRVNPQFDVDKTLAAVDDLRAQFGDAVRRMRNDFLDTQSLREHCQTVVDKRVADDKQDQPGGQT